MSAPERDARQQGGEQPIGPFLDLLRRDGADLVTAEGVPAPRTFGDPEEEYGALWESAALVEGLDRSALEIRGEEAREHFGGLVTNHVEALEPGRALYAFMLTPKGRPVAEMRVLSRPPEEGEEVLWVDLPVPCRDGALEHLGRFLPPRLARHRPLPDLARLSVVGPEAGAALAASLPDAAVPPAPLDAASSPDDWDGGVTVVRREPQEGPGFDLYLHREVLPAAWEELSRAVAAVGGRPAGREAREIWRVERGLPAYGPEINLDVLPQETGQEERAVAFDKGCYTGQEVVAKIHYRGRVNRHLRGLRLPGDAGLPNEGQELYDGSRARGSLTTVVRSPRLGPVALGYVRREVQPGGRLALEAEGEPVVEVVELPFPDPSGD